MNNDFSSSQNSGVPHAVRVFNKIAGVISRFREPNQIDLAKVLPKAIARAGVSDFGDRYFEDPLERYVDSVNREGRLTPFGVWFNSRNLEIHLANRLCVEHYKKQHPGCTDRPLRKPVFVIGLPRTGTTLLYNLLAMDDAARPQLMREAMFPAPLPRDKRRDSRPRRTYWIAKLIKRMAPDLEVIHAVDPKGPEECSRNLASTFVSWYLVMENRCPSYLRWLESASDEVLHRVTVDLRQQLQVIDHQRPAAGHWLLKSPALIFHMKPLVREFPDACIVHTSRDPAEVIPSACSLFATYRGIGSEDVDRRELGPEFLRTSISGAQSAAKAKEELGSDRFADVEYLSFIARPIETVCEIYEKFEMTMPPAMIARMQKYLERNPHNKHGRHVYSAEQFGLTSKEICAGFADSQVATFGL